MPFRPSTWIVQALLLLSITSSVASAATEEGIEVTVEVRDYDTNEVIPTAVVRHPEEAVRHRVNVKDGRWKDKILYLSDGTELVFTKGKSLTFEVSAPGYKNETATYVVRKRKNLVNVLLTKMEISLDEDFANEPNISFGRDRPLDK